MRSRTAALYETIAAAEDLSEDDYTEEEWVNIQDALAAAKAALNGESTQEAVDTVETELREAIGKIEPTAHTLTLKFTTNAMLLGDNVELANLTGTYTEELLPKEAFYAFHFAPRVAGREFLQRSPWTMNRFRLTMMRPIQSPMSVKASWAPQTRPSRFPL